MAKAVVFHFTKALVDAGLLTEEEMINTRRIVIDITNDAVPVLYIEKYGDDSALAKLAPMLKGMFRDG